MVQRKQPGTRFSRKIDDAMTVAERLLSGEKLTSDELNPLQWLEQYLRLDKPLLSYAKRTRQRYVSGAYAGRTAPATRELERTRRTERVQSKYGPTVTASQGERLERLRKQLVDSGVDIDYYLDYDIIQYMLSVYGYTYLRTVWTWQLESIESYNGGAGSVEPGRSRWFSRGELEDEHVQILDIYLPHGTDPYYYYHGRHA